MFVRGEFLLLIDGVYLLTHVWSYNTRLSLFVSANHLVLVVRTQILCTPYILTHLRGKLFGRASLPILRTSGFLMQIGS